MIHNNAELHNIEELREVNGRDGLRLQRVPEDVRMHINPEGRTRCLQPTNAEIRFVLDGKDARVTLSSAGRTDVTVFQGDFIKRRLVVERDKQEIAIQLDDRLPRLSGKDREALCFDPSVLRLVFGGLSNDAVYLHDISGDGIRPPGGELLPKRRLLAYGTSITQGFSASHSDLSYAAQTAWHLRADLINLGLAGTALCEPELADWIAARQDWNIGVLALSVNMIGHGFAVDAFYERVAYMVRTVTASDESRPVFCVTIYPCFFDMGENFIQSPPPAPVEEYRQALREAVAASGCANAHLIEGPEVLTDIRGLTQDLIHPSDNGMILMGHNLARTISSRIANDAL